MEQLSRSAARLCNALRRAAETGILPNQAMGALRRLEDELKKPATQSADLVTMEAVFSAVLGPVLNLESEIKNNEAANVPTYGQMLNLPMLSLREVQRVKDALLSAFKAYKVARGAVIRHGAK